MNWGERVTAEGDVGDSMLAEKVEGIGEEAIERLGQHRKIGGVLEELQSGGLHPQSVL